MKEIYNNNQGYKISAEEEGSSLILTISTPNGIAPKVSINALQKFEVKTTFSKLNQAVIDHQKIDTAGLVEICGRIVRAEAAPAIAEAVAEYQAAYVAHVRKCLFCGKVVEAGYHDQCKACSATDEIMYGKGSY